jgi:hypothetical protein
MDICDELIMPQHLISNDLINAHGNSNWSVAAVNDGWFQMKNSRI